MKNYKIKTRFVRSEGKIVCYTMLYMLLLEGLRTGSNPEDINRFQSHTEKKPCSALTWTKDIS